MLVNTSFLAIVAIALASVSASPASAPPQGKPGSPSKGNSPPIRGPSAPIPPPKPGRPAVPRPTGKAPTKSKSVSAKPTSLTSSAAHKPTPTNSPAAQGQGQGQGQVQGGILRDPDFLIKAHQMAEYASAAYHIKSFAWDCPKCRDRRSHIRDTRVIRAFVSQNHGNGYVAFNTVSHDVIVAFRGTNSYQELLKETLAVPADWIYGGKVHIMFKQFYEGVSSVVQEGIKEAVALQRKPDAKIMFVGHSLGGAIASLSVSEFIAWDRKGLASKAMLFTFGQPRVGDKKFADMIDNNVRYKYRFTYGIDPVPRLPPQMLGYVHHGQEFYYPPSGTLTECAQYGESDKCINSRPFDPLAGVKDHSAYPGL
ncbi:hypothetical protein GGI12_002215 [Dipsacomyces acuminosporus]|nr:hypothetical protein GGI12_002215 [Dipsacomyces acuminosporus]